MHQSRNWLEKNQTTEFLQKTRAFETTKTNQAYLHSTNNSMGHEWDHECKCCQPKDEKGIAQRD